MGAPKRQPWRETLEAGIYRVHSLACPATDTRDPGRRCACPMQIAVPGSKPRSRRLVTVRGSIREARAERTRLLAEGRRAEKSAGFAAGTLEDFVQHYLRTKSATLADAAIYTTEESYRLRISPEFGHLPLDAITRERVERWLAALVAQASSRRMVTKTFQALRVILNTAEEWGAIDKSPMARLRLPAPETHLEQSSERVLTHAQLEQLCTNGAAPGTSPARIATRLRIETMLRAAGEAGLRRGEVIGLKWGDVDLAARRLDVRRSIWQRREKDRTKIEKPTKGRRRRRVAISQVFAARLAEFRKVSADGGADAFVWPGKDGAPLAADSPTQMLERALARVGLVDTEGRGLVTFHGLRHTAGSIALSRGVPLILVSRQLGHANPQITASVYAHLLEDEELDRVAAVFDTPAA